MATSKTYLQFIRDQLSGLDGVRLRAMMGEYLLYYRDKLVGGIYDDRVLVKPISEAVAYMPGASYEIPYEGAKEMLLVDDVDNPDYLAGLLQTMYPALPEPKSKKPRKTRQTARTDKPQIKGEKHDC